MNGPCVSRALPSPLHSSVRPSPCTHSFPSNFVPLLTRSKISGDSILKFGVVDIFRFRFLLLSISLYSVSFLNRTTNKRVVRLFVRSSDSDAFRRGLRWSYVGEPLCPESVSDFFRGEFHLEPSVRHSRSLDTFGSRPKRETIEYRTTDLSRRFQSCPVPALLLGTPGFPGSVRLVYRDLCSLIRGDLDTKDVSPIRVMKRTPWILFINVDNPLIVILEDS